MVDEVGHFAARPVEYTLSDHEDENPKSENDEEQGDEGEDEDVADEPRRTFTFPELDRQIREAISQYGSVFPKLNFSSPRVSRADLQLDLR